MKFSLRYFIILAMNALGGEIKMTNKQWNELADKGYELLQQVALAQEQGDQNKVNELDTELRKIYHELLN